MEGLDCRESIASYRDQDYRGGEVLLEKGDRTCLTSKRSYSAGVREAGAEEKKARYNIFEAYEVDSWREIQNTKGARVISEKGKNENSRINQREIVKKVREMVLEIFSEKNWIEKIEVEKRKEKKRGYKNIDTNSYLLKIEDDCLYV